MRDFSLLFPILKEGGTVPPSLLEEAVEQFPRLGPREQVALIVFGRKVPRIKRILEEKLPLEVEIKTALLEGEIREVTIPAVDWEKGEGKLSRIYVIEDSPTTWTNAGEYQRVLESKISPLTGKNFIALFEEKFEGYSFLLPLAVALLKPKLLERYCFSGNLDAAGNLIPVDGVEKKGEACQREGKTLITSNDFDHLQHLIEYLTTTPKEVPIFIAAKGRNEGVLRQSFQLLAKGLKQPPPEKFLKRILQSPPYKDLGILENEGEWKESTPPLRMQSFTSPWTDPPRWLSPTG